MDKETSEAIQNIDGHLQKICKQQGELLKKMDAQNKLLDALVTTNKHLAEINHNIKKIGEDLA
ncbi:MAG: hypothetical protein OXN90_01955 [Gemmatimonadota bacterium]|nr:hypothetical protein [Gemmatimonadota bacterium]